MNLSFFIARRIGVRAQKSFSRLITRIAIVAIALSMMVMILATSIVQGFKNTISEKIFGFWGHIHITGSINSSHYAFENRPLSKKQPYYPALDTIGGCAIVTQQEITTGKIGEEVRSQAGIRHIQVYANKEGIIKTKDEIEGIILRGISTDYDWNFLKNYIIQGDTLATNVADNYDNILISETTSKRLKLSLGDTLAIYFAQEGGSLAREFRIQGIYRTGLEEYDRRFALVDIRQIQQLNGWRPFRDYETISLGDEKPFLRGLTNGTNFPEYFATNTMSGNSVINWDDTTCIDAIAPASLVEASHWTLGDTISMVYQEEGTDSITLKFVLKATHTGRLEGTPPNTIFVPYYQLNKLNYSLYDQVSGFEIYVENIADLDIFGEFVNYEVLLGRNEYAYTIRELEPNIFDWLSLTDMNERIILILMILVAVINMITSLMILILERTNMIGILKALGSTNWAIRKIFLYYAAYIVGMGLLLGNVLGIGFGILQQQFGIITLPEDLYYVSTAPVQFNFLMILYLNIGTLVITLLVLILPSYLVSRIEPVRAIRFK